MPGKWDRYWRFLFRGKKLIQGGKSEQGGFLEGRLEQARGQNGPMFLGSLGRGAGLRRGVGVQFLLGRLGLG